MSELKQRVIVGSITVAILALMIGFSNLSPIQPLIAIIVAFIGGEAAWEYYRLGMSKGFNPLIRIGTASTIIYIIASFGETIGWLPSGTSVLFIIAGLMVALMVHLKLPLKEEPLVNIALTALGIVYVGIPLALIVKILFAADPSQGRLWLIYLLVVTKIADTAAYFCGKRLGKRLLAGKISPAKTLEGFIGGVMVATFVASLAPFIGLQISVAQAGILGLVLAIVGQFGDLAESLLKRDAKVKDSNSIPGLGGVLDMLDSLLFTAPVVYGFITLVG
ncbi:MAG: phosphatidate cytidylyltransferase [Chlamydiota bacterium]